MDLNLTVQSYNKKDSLVSIIMLVYNAPLLTLQTLYTLKRTKNVNYEVVVLDNGSKPITKWILQKLYNLGYIDTIVTSKENTYFAGGNNLAAKYCNESSKYYLLLNSDIKIKNPHWLEYLINAHKYGITSIGVCNLQEEHARCDGYCFLINRELYDKYKLDENYKWWYGITQLQSQILNVPGCHVRGCIDNSKLIKHYWGGSGKAYKKVNNVLPKEEIAKWFAGTINKFELIEIPEKTK